MTPDDVIRVSLGLETTTYNNRCTLQTEDMNQQQISFLNLEIVVDKMILILND